MEEQEAKNEVRLKNPNVAIQLDVLHKPGAVKLDNYHLLVYAPIEHGPGIRTEDNGTPVADIVNMLATNPDREAVASKFKTTKEHVDQAVEYAIETSKPTDLKHDKT